MSTIAAAIVTPRTVGATHLSEISGMTETRLKTHISELDNVLSGGIVEGSLILIGGDPGIGKSTLLLQICQNVSLENGTILYVSGEESIGQIKMRADRLDVTTDQLLLAAETNLRMVEQMIEDLKPKLVIIDSIQTIYNEETGSVPGSVTQVKACTSTLTRLAKTMNISIFIVGHVTKEGALAGPRVLEHMVDTVLYFEGERRESYRIIRAVKNRFGSTNEIGVFEMSDAGLVSITNPSEYLLTGRPINVPGSVVTCAIEGTRPILAEVQALTTYTNFGTPRRTATGLDYNRIIMLLAVLEKHTKTQLSNVDCYINLTGGVRLAEPALDTAVVVAAASGLKNKAANPFAVTFGEVGLTGELRSVSYCEKRITEAEKMGFTQCVIPKANMKGLGLKDTQKCRVLGAANINELLEACLG
jgi:DNA repair protein RadA/Sms